jgi:hypothetical protein
MYNYKHITGTEHFELTLTVTIVSITQLSIVSLLYTTYTTLTVTVMNIT